MAETKGEMVKLTLEVEVPVEHYKKLRNVTNLKDLLQKAVSERISKLL